MNFGGTYSLTQTQKTDFHAVFGSNRNSSTSLSASATRCASTVSGKAAQLEPTAGMVLTAGRGPRLAEPSRVLEGSLWGNSGHYVSKYAGFWAKSG